MTTGTVSFTHPEFPRLALRATDLGNGSWKRELIVDGEVAHTLTWPDVHPSHANAQYQASQEGLWIGGWSGDPAKSRKDFGPLVTPLISDIEELAFHIANGRVVGYEETEDGTVRPVDTII